MQSGLYHMIGRKVQRAWPLALSLFIGITIVAAFFLWPRHILEGTPEATSTCMKYLNESGRATKDDVVVDSTSHIKLHLLEIKFVSSEYSTKEYRNRNIKYEYCQMFNNFLDKKQSDQNFEIRAKPHIERCVENYRVELPGQQGWHVRMKKHRQPTELEKQEMRDGWCRGYGIRQMHRISQFKDN